jgi:hypothetical protein
MSDSTKNPIAGTPRFDPSVTLTPYFLRVLSSYPQKVFIFGFFTPQDHFRHSVEPTILQLSTALSQNLLPIFEHWCPVISMHLCVLVLPYLPQLFLLFSLVI